MAKIKWTEPALIDLEDIAEYIALDKPSAAKTFVKEVFKAVNRLKKFPKSGKVPLEFEGGFIREIVSGPCRIFYRITDKTVYILYVMRSERELRNFIINDREKGT